MTTALRKCAWCERSLEKGGPKMGPVTHGICDPCLQKFFPEHVGEVLAQSKP